LPAVGSRQLPVECSQLPSEPLTCNLFAFRSCCCWVADVAVGIAVALGVAAGKQEAFDICMAGLCGDFWFSICQWISS